MESKVKAGPTIELIRSRLAAARPARDPRERLRANIDGPVSPALVEVLAHPGRPASVLLALLERPVGLCLLLTERAAHLKDHAGQISLPGGRLAPGETPAAAALREAQEEVGLPPDGVTVLGTLDPLLTGTGFTVTPVVGVVTDPNVRAGARSARGRRCVRVAARARTAPERHHGRLLRAARRALEDL